MTTTGWQDAWAKAIRKLEAQVLTERKIAENYAHQHALDMATMKHSLARAQSWQDAAEKYADRCELNLAQAMRRLRDLEGGKK